MFRCVQCGAWIELEVGICINADGDFVCSIDCKNEWEINEELNYIDITEDGSWVDDPELGNKG